MKPGNDLKSKEGKVPVTAKQAALKIIAQMPSDASLEDIMYELYFRQRVDRGLQELDAGQTISHEEVKRNLAKWLQSSGQ
jgi:predicted transcriptional regulator